MREVSHPPFAPAVIESLRAIGYSFETALADILDNSIAADAQRIQIRFRSSDGPYLAVIDDGRGMTEAELLEAMRHGGLGPASERAEGDLGRFGLGLKTASLSQCRRLTVITHRDGTTSAAVWDLDRIAQRGDWTLGIPEGDEVARLPHVDLIEAAGRGTIVLWQEFDRATAGETDPAKALEEHVDRARSHLELAFHRFIGGGARGDARKVTIDLNGTPLDLIDPYLTSRKADRELPPEDIRVEGEKVRVVPYILPHLSRLTKREIELAGAEDGLRTQQGFYVYRNFRLIIHGTWFRLMPKGELTKLARVQVDIPNSLDHLWSLDVKKSTATPPYVVRRALAQFIDRVGQRSIRVINHRGEVIRRDDLQHLWHRIDARDGVEYRLNRAHPAILTLQAAIPNGRAVEDLLRFIELTLPSDSIYADMAGDVNVLPPVVRDELEAELEEKARAILDVLATDTKARASMIETLPRLDPFYRHPEVTKKIVERLNRAR